MKTFEIEELEERASEHSTSTLNRYLGDMLDAIYVLRATFASRAVGLEKVLELRTFPKSRRDFANAQVALFSAVARGDHADAAHTRDATVFRGIRFYGKNTAPDPEIARRDEEPPTDDAALIAACAGAVVELRNLRALLMYEAGVLQAHHSGIGTPKSLERFINEASAEFTKLAKTTSAEFTKLPYREDAKRSLKKVGAHQTLTTPQYVDRFRD